MTKQERCDRAKQCHARGENCAQSILSAFIDRTGLTKAQCVGVASGFGGGMRCGSICGALSGAVMVLGMLYPAADLESKKKNTALTKEFTRRYCEQFGYINCKELLSAEGLRGTPYAQSIAGCDHCGLMIYSAAEMLSDFLVEME